MSELKLSVFEEKKVEEKQKEATLRLFQSGGEIYLRAVDKEGNYITRGNLLVFQANGALRRDGSVNPNLGFKLDDHGRVEVS